MSSDGDRLLAPSNDNDQAASDDAGYLQIPGETEMGIPLSSPSYKDYDETEAEFEPVVNQPKNGLAATASTIVSNMIGVGVLGLPTAVKGLGWGLFTVMLLLFTGLSMYSSLVLGWLKGSMASLHGYPELAEDAAKGRGEKSQKFYRRLVSGILFAYLQGVCTLYIITMKLSLEAVFEQCGDPTLTNTTAPTFTPRGASCESPACTDHGVVDLPDTLWLFFAVVVVFPFVHYRSLAKNAWLSFVGVATILVVDVVVLIRCLEELGKGRHAADTQHHWELRDVVNSITIMAFAYGGHALMPDILAEMKDQKQFPKAVYYSQGFMFINYAIIGFVGYAAYGNAVQSPITLSLPPDGVSIFTNILLLLHVGVAYCINSTVFVRNLFDAIWPGFVHTSTDRTLLRRRWGGLSLGVLLLSFMVAVVIPYFSDLMDVYASISIFALSIWVPALLMLLAKQGSLSIALLMFNVMLIVIAFVFSGLGTWAAFDDLVDKLRHCQVRFSQ
eukprot:TRINITY_DN10068_c0_g1_i1.p1 TRINITY_DN10068_c0_g1~~TRINITY_DN10068_c0_g1_i1.p1  ORF type:complete len:500 (+),score=98.61 TRINITY_DN10068_c0_g1_i1:103-1602(+)